MPAIAVRGLVKCYGGRAVVDGIDLAVAAGEVVALLGPNGAGKTTTVECVEGFRRPDQGTVRVLEHDPIAERDAVVSRLGVMLQEGGLYQAATPREMVRLFARFHADPLDADGLIDRVGLAAVARRGVSDPVGGEKQRLNLALALVGRPTVAILDEPTAGMDPHARREAWALIGELRAGGTAVLLTTHALDEAERIADRIVILGAGRVMAEGTSADLRAHAGAGGLEDAYFAILDGRAGR